MHRFGLQSVALAAYVLVWVTLWHVAAATALTTGTSLWYPPAALTFSLLALRGPAWLWLPFVASIMAGRELWQDFPTVFEVGGSLSHVVSYGVAAIVFRRFTTSPRVALTSDRLAIFLLSGLLGAALSAALGTLNHELASLQPEIPTGRALVAWFVGDALGVVSLAPFLVFVAYRSRRRVLCSRHLQSLLQPGYRLIQDLILIALLTGAVGGSAWMARVELVPISALAAGGVLIILTGRRPPRQSLTTLTIVMSVLAVGGLVVPAQRELIEGGLVMLVSTLLTFLTLQQTVALRLERARHESLRLRLAGVRREYTTAAQQLERLKTRIAEIGHELRTPLNAITGYAGLIRITAGEQESSITAERAKIIEHSGEYLLILVNDIVDSESLRLGRLSLQLRPTNTGEVLHSVATMLEHQAATKEQKLEVEADDDLPLVTADPVRLKQVLVNLTQNAIKYSPPKRPITLSAQMTPSLRRVRLSVIDEGPGLSGSDLDLALQPFMRANDAEQEGGSGIGLPLSLALVREMGGEADVNTAPERGTAVNINLPCDAASGQTRRSIEH